MQALFFTQTGSLDELHLAERPIPTPQADEVLVKIHAAAINPSDAKNVEGLMRHTTLPRIPGRDFAGTVVGGALELLGKSIFGTGGELGFTRDGTHAEYCALPAGALALLPNGMSFEQGASLGVGCVTAVTALDRSSVQQGETVVITGASGAVGRAAAGLARLRGALVIGIVRNAERAVGLAGICNETIVAHAESLAEAVMNYTNGRGADVVIDTIGGAYFGAAIQTLAGGGRLVVMSATGSRRAEFDLLHFYRKEAHIIGVNTLRLDFIACARLLTLHSEELHAALPPYRTLPLTEFQNGYRETLERPSPEKIVFVM